MGVESAGRLKSELSENMDGLISFFGSFHAVRAESVMKRDGLAAQLIPGPKELSPNCGVALRFDYDQREHVVALLLSKRVQIESVHRYQPRTDEWHVRRGGSLLERMKRWM